jgi:hypothetical protein
MYTYIHIYMLTYTHPQCRELSHMYVHASRDTYIHIHTHTYTYIHINNTHKNRGFAY